VANDFAELEAHFPGRALLGIGIGHPEATSSYRKPLAAMQVFLDELNTAETPVPRTRRCLAALGPKMLELSAERALGAHPYFVPVEHTQAARKLLGDTSILAPELACVLDDDVESARAKARNYAAPHLEFRNYTNNLLKHGFSQQGVDAAGSDRLIDTIIPHGGASAIAEAARQHLGAGANHVCLQTVELKGIPRSEWTALASALGLTG
jgi:probable F420-dependent oxidoreductase